MVEDGFCGHDCEFDTTTWDGVDYKLLVDLAHKNIAPRALYEQQCKHHAQMVALTASNNVVEGRRSDQVAAHS